MWPFLLLSLLLLLAPEAGQAQPFPPKPHLTPELLGRLSGAARDSTLAPWQRDFMLGVARDSAEAAATHPSPALPSGVVRSDEIAADGGSWMAIGPPFWRRYHAAIYDPVRDRMVVFGGDNGGPNLGVWALSLAGSPAWSLLSTAGSPPSGRFLPTAIYDPVRDRMVVFGGNDGPGNGGGPRNDVWALSLADRPAWSTLTPEGTPPSGRYAHTAIYDPVRDRMVVFGGRDANVWPQCLRNDVWALSLSGSLAWSELTPAGGPPSGREAHTAIYDPLRDRMVTFGGLDYGPCNDAWALSLAGSPIWSALAPAGSPPPARFWHAATYDPVRDQMVVFGGFDFGKYHSDVWALSLAGSPAWIQPSPLGGPPSARYGDTAIYDPVRDQMVMFGGYDGTSLRNDAWALSLSGRLAWSDLAPGGSPPAGYVGHTAIHDPVRDRMVVFGGSDDTSLRNDMRALSLSGSPAWSDLAVAGSPPSARFWHTAMYDPLRDRMVVFGGSDDYGVHYLNDVWALSLAGSPVWNALTPVAAPPPRGKGSAIYDPVRDRMVVFGGDDNGSLRNDVWVLSLAGSPAWSELAPVGSPPSTRYGHTAIYDPVRDRMVVFGGNGAPGDVWVLSFAGSPAWSELTPTGTPPSARFGHTAIYDRVRDRMVVYGGYGAPGNDVWALSFAGRPAWIQLSPSCSPPVGRFVHTAIYEPLRDRMMVYGGLDGCNDAWALVWGTPVPDVEVAFDFTPGTLNLMSSGLWVTGYLEPSTPFAASDIDIASIRLNGTVPAAPTAPTALGDHDRNGAPDLMVKFNRAAVELTLFEGDNVPVTVIGTVAGHAFSATDHIRVRRAGKNAEQVLEASDAVSNQNVVGVSDWAMGRLAMRGATPNPMVDGRLWVEFSLRDDGPARLELMDVTGRVVTSKQVESLGPGVRLLDLSEGAELRPGIYFLRLTQGGNEVRARAAVIK